MIDSAHDFFLPHHAVELKLLFSNFARVYRYGLPPTTADIPDPRDKQKPPPIDQRMARRPAPHHSPAKNPQALAVRTIVTMKMGQATIKPSATIPRAPAP
jgi:hypothetical protein